MFTDAEIMTIMQCDRNVRNVTADAQVLINRKNAQIGALQRQLAATQRDLAAARAEIAAMRQERGQANMAEFHRIRALKAGRTH